MAFYCSWFSCCKVLSRVSVSGVRLVLSAESLLLPFSWSHHHPSETGGLVSCTLRTFGFWCRSSRCLSNPPLRARARTPSHFRIPSSGHLGPIFSRTILNVGLATSAVVLTQIDPICHKSGREFWGVIVSRALWKLDRHNVLVAYLKLWSH